MKYRAAPFLGAIRWKICDDWGANASERLCARPAHLRALSSGGPVDLRVRMKIGALPSLVWCYYGILFNYTCSLIMQLIIIVASVGEFRMVMFSLCNTDHGIGHHLHYVPVALLCESFWR